MKKNLKIEIELSLEEVSSILIRHLEKSQGISGLKMIRNDGEFGAEGGIVFQAEAYLDIPPHEKKAVIPHSTRPNWGVGPSIRAVFKDYREYEIHDVLNLLKEDFPNLNLEKLRLYIKRKDMVGYPIIEVTKNRYKRRSDS